MNQSLVIAAAEKIAAMETERFFVLGMGRPTGHNREG